MRLNKLILGISVAQLTGLGLIAMPAIMDPALTGLTDAQRKVLLFIDPQTAALLGVNTDHLEPEPKNAVHLDHAELQARYVGAYFEGHDYLASVFDVNNDLAIEPHVSDITTVAFALSKSKAVELSLIEDSPNIAENTIVVAIQGASADILMDSILDAGVIDRMPRKTVASFFASEHFDNPSATEPERVAA